MECLWCIFIVSAILPQWSSEIELSMQGTVNLGQDVVDALSRYVEMKKPTRRSLTRRFSRDRPGYIGTDTIAKIVDKAYLCRNIEFCQDELGLVINKYVTTLAEGMELVFESLVNAINNDEETNNIILFEEELKELIIDIKLLLRSADNDTTVYETTVVWANIVKKINAKFIAKAIIFTDQRLEGSPNEIIQIKKKVTQKIVIVTSVIELEFENILCKEHNICIETFECTESLVTILENLKTGSDDNIKGFLKHFYYELPRTKLFKTLAEDTAASFQAILHEMANSDNITRNILTAVHKSVKDRQNVLISKYKVNDRKFGRDVKLVHIILSDMDFIFSKLKAPFHDFLSDFFYWIKDGGRFGLSMRRVMKDIQNKLSFTPDDLVNKLILEVNVFMELTVDPRS